MISSPTQTLARDIVATHLLLRLWVPLTAFLMAAFTLSRLSATLFPPSMAPILMK